MSAETGSTVPWIQGSIIIKKYAIESTDSYFRDPQVYIAKYEEAIYVLHAFKKKSQKTPKRDIDIARTRFRELEQERKL